MSVYSNMERAKPSRPAIITTEFGARTVVRRIGVSGEYYQTLPTGSAPHGEWWTLNPQRGFVPVASNSRALLATLAKESARIAGNPHVVRREIARVTSHDPCVMKGCVHEYGHSGSHEYT